MIQNAYSKSPTHHLITYQTTWSHRSLTKLIIMNHHSTRNTWEHIASIPIWTYFFCLRMHHRNSKIVFWIQPWHYRRKQNVPPECTVYVDIICRRLRCVRWKVWFLEVGFCMDSRGGGGFKCSCTSTSSPMKTLTIVLYRRQCELICCAIALHIRKKLKEQILIRHLHSTGEIVILRKEINFLSGSLNLKAL